MAVQSVNRALELIDALRRVESANVFEGVGHLTFSECPEQFNSVTLDFLARHPLQVDVCRS